MSSCTPSFHTVLVRPASWGIESDPPWPVVGRAAGQGPGAAGPWGLSNQAFASTGPGARPAWAPGRSAFDAFTLWKSINSTCAVHTGPN